MEAYSYQFCFKEKLPDDVKLLIGRKLPTEEWTLENVLKILRTEVETKECCGLTTNPKSKKQTYHSSHFTKQQASASTLIVPEGKKPKCTYFQGKHATVDCQTVTNVNSRKQILRRRNGQCFLCLRKNHNVHQQLYLKWKMFQMFRPPPREHM